MLDERGRVKLNMNRLQRLKEFNLIKLIFFRNCNDEQVIDLDLLLNLI